MTMYALCTTLFLLLTATTTAAANNVCATVDFGYQPRVLQCKGSHHRTLKVPCVDAPGSPCISDHDRLPGISVKDTYCTKESFRQTVYHGTESCDETKDGARKEELIYPKDQCHTGMIFRSCTAGDCEREEEEVEMQDLGLWLVSMTEAGSFPVSAK